MTAANRQVSLDTRRVELAREIRIRVHQFGDFVTEYSGNISVNGMFIITENPQPAGTEIAFEFSVAEDWKLIRGACQVAWVRHRSEGPGRPPGMGVRFSKIDRQSRRLIRWLVEKNVREGGKPFELEELRSVIDGALDTVLTGEQGLEAGEAGLEPPATATDFLGAGSWAGDWKAGGPAEWRRDWKAALRNLGPLIATAGIVIFLVIALIWLVGRGSDAPPEIDLEAAAELPEPADVLATRNDAVDLDGAADADPEPAAVSPTPRATAELPVLVGPPEGPPVGSAFRSVAGFLETWSEAWSGRDADRYLSLYASAFQPPTGLAREDWAALRRQRLSEPGYIRVAVSGLEIERVTENRIDATFFQSYRSDVFTDEVTKKLQLVWEDGGWRIGREIYLGPVPADDLNRSRPIESGGDPSQTPGEEQPRAGRRSPAP